MASVLSAECITALRALGTCAVSDALVKLGSPHGGYLPDINHIGSGAKTLECPVVCGPAFTVKMVSQKDTQAPKPSQHFVDAAEPQSVMIISAPAECKNAVWGGLMSAGAATKGVKGVVIAGRCRDLSELRSYDLPIFSKGHSTLGQSPFTRPSVLQEPISIASDEASFPAVKIAPGDAVVADEDGVVIVPAADVQAVIEKAKSGQHVDALCQEDILKGQGIAETFKRRRG